MDKSTLIITKRYVHTATNQDELLQLLQPQLLQIRQKDVAIQQAPVVNQVQVMQTAQPANVQNQGQLAPLEANIQNPEPTFNLGLADNQIVEKNYSTI